MSSKQKIIEVFLLFLLSLPPLIWLWDRSIILGHDSGFRLKYLDYYRDLFFSWNPYVGFGADLSLNKGFLLTQLPETFFIYVFQDINTGQIISSIFWFFMIGFSMYLFTKSLFSKSEQWPIRIFSSLLYMYNFFVLQGWFISERAKFSLIIALPLVLLVLWKLFQEKWSPLRSGVIIGLTLFLFNGGGSPPLFGAVLLSSGLVFLVLAFFCLKKNWRRGLLYSIKSIGFIVFFTLLFNMYWLVPQAYLAFTTYGTTLSGQGGVEGILAWEAVVTKFASMNNLLRLQGVPDWYENPIHPYARIFLNNPALIAFSFYPFFMIASGLFFYSSLKTKYKNDLLMFIVLLLVVIGLLFSAGSHEPFGIMYKQLLLHVPGFAIFRSAFYKFGPVLWFSVSFLFGYMIFVLKERFKKNRKIVLGIYGITGVYLVLFAFPFYNPSFFDWHEHFSTRVKIPDYVFQMNDHINKEDDENGRILLLPGSVSGADQYAWGFWSLDSLPRISLNRSIVSNDMTIRDLDPLYAKIYSEDTQSVRDMLSLLQVDHILVRNDIFEENGVPFSYADYAAKLTDIDGELVTYGKWQYFSLNSISNSFFSIPETIYGIDDQIKLPEAIDSVSDISNIAFTNFPTQTNSFSDSYKGFIVTAVCVICSSKDYNDIEKGVIISNPQILPDSPLYAVIKNQRKKSLQVKMLAPQKIDRELSYSTLKLAELNKLFEKDPKEAVLTGIHETIREYLSSLTIIESEIPRLNQIEKEIYFPRILAYLQVQHRYAVLFSDASKYPSANFNGLLSKQDSFLETLNTYQVSNESKHYIVTIPQKGAYTIVAPAIESKRVLIDGKVVDASEKQTLSEGQHVILVETESYQNILDDKVYNKNVNLAYSERQSLQVDIDSKQTYLLEIGVDDIEGIDPKITITEWSEPRSKPIQSETRNLSRVHNSLAYEFTPHPSARSIEITFWVEGYTYERSAFTIESMSLIAVADDTFSLRLDNLSSNITVPDIIQTKKIDPTLYDLRIKNVTGPFLLVFHQSFNTGWSAYLVGEKRSMWEIVNVITSGEAVQDHVKVNTYMNGWFIDKKGDFSVLLLYWPQIYFYCGLSISVIALLSLIVYLVVSRRNK